MSLRDENPQLTWKYENTYTKHHAVLVSIIYWEYSYWETFDKKIWFSFPQICFHSSL